MAADDKVLFHSHTHWKALLPAVLAALLLLGAEVLFLKFFPGDTMSWEWGATWIPVIVHSLAAVLALWYVAFPLLRWNSETYTLTSHALRNDWGVLNRNSREIELSRIASISEERDLIDRLFRCGTLNFYDPAAGAQPETKGVWNSPKTRATAGVRFHDIPQVKRVRALIEEQRDLSMER